MPFDKSDRLKDRRDIGQVVFVQEKIMTARNRSSCCVGVESALEADVGFEGLKRRLADGSSASKAWLENLLRVAGSS
jgi:hypothetical protein